MFLGSGAAFNSVVRFVGIAHERAADPGAGKGFTGAAAAPCCVDS